MNHMSREVVTIGEFLVHLFERSRGASSLFASLERKERNELEADPSFSSIFLLFSRSSFVL